MSGMIGAIVAMVALIVIFTLFERHLERKDDERPLPGALRLLFVIPLLLFAVSAFNGMFFYAQPGYIYHVRTIWGDENVIVGTGYKIKGFGYTNAWKQSISVQAVRSQGEFRIQAEQESTMLSASIPSKKVVFLDQVDAVVSASARWQLPSDEPIFLRLAHQYRSPENLLRTELIPAFYETLEANASLMGADEYFSGGKTTFISEFEEQLRSGIYQVRRIEVAVDSNVKQVASANAALGDEQEEYGGQQQMVYDVEKLLDDTGIPLRKKQTYSDYGLTLVSARITDLEPNDAFNDRMQSKQDAAAARAVAREQRIQEEEQRKLAVTRGEREVAERQAEAKVEQIQRTTDAETEKQLAITKAEQLRESEKVLLEAARIQEERAKVEAAAVKIRADAEAYQRREIVKADDALAQKLETATEINKVWADAYSKRSVPGVVIGGANGESPTGSDAEAQALMNMLMVSLAKDLEVNTQVSNSN